MAPSSVYLYSSVWLVSLDNCFLEIRSSSVSGSLCVEILLTVNVRINNKQFAYFVKAGYRRDLLSTVNQAAGTEA